MKQFSACIAGMLLLVGVLTGCHATSEISQMPSDGPPQWYLSGEVAGFDRETYLIGMGTGITKEDALAEAQGIIGSQIKVSVETTVETFSKEINSVDQSDYFETFLTQSTITSSETLTGSQIIRQEQISGTWYVAAALHKQRFLSQMQLTLQDLQAQIDQQLQHARSAATEGEIPAAMELYRKAFDTLVSSYTIRSYIEALGNLRIPFRAPDIAAEVNALLGSIEISLIAGNDQSAPQGAMLMQPLVFQVTAHSLPVSRIPVTVRFADGSAIGRYTSGSDGTISVPIRAVASGRVQAIIDLSALMQPFTGNLGRVEAIAQYSVTERQERGAVTLTILNTRGQQMQDLEHTLTGKLHQLGISVSDTADWQIKGTCTITAQKQIASYQGTQYMATVDLFLELIDNEGRQRDHITISRTQISTESDVSAVAAAEKSFDLSIEQLALLLDVF